MLKNFFALFIFLAALQVQAQTATPSSPAKKELVAKILKVQQGAIEGVARGLVEQPASELMAGAASALPTRVAKDKQDAVAKEIQADIQKYVNETTPLVRERALSLAPSTVGALLEERFSEDELKQILAMLEAPVYVKFQRLGEEMQRALIDKVITETRTTVEPRLRALEQTIGKRLGLTSTGSAPAGPTRSSAKASVK